MLPPGTFQKPLLSICGAAHGKGMGLMWHIGTQGGDVTSPIPNSWHMESLMSKGCRESLIQQDPCTDRGELQGIPCSNGLCFQKTTVISTWSCHLCAQHCSAHTPFSWLEVQPESFLVTCVTPSSNPLMTSCLPILNLKGLFLSLEESNFFPFCSIPAKTRHTVSI